jgi:hypothetical protein
VDEGLDDLLGGLLGVRDDDARASVGRADDGGQAQGVVVLQRALCMRQEHRAHVEHRDSGVLRSGARGKPTSRRDPAVAHWSASPSGFAWDARLFTSEAAVVLSKPVAPIFCPVRASYSAMSTTIGWFFAVMGVPVPTMRSSTLAFCTLVGDAMVTVGSAPKSPFTVTESVRPDDFGCVGQACPARTDLRSSRPTRGRPGRG